MKRVFFASGYVKGIQEAWESQGYQVYQFAPPLHEQPEAKVAEQIRQHLKEIDYVFSLNFYPVLAEACHQCRVRYISWAVDCPMLSLWSNTALYETNRIFAFDYNQYRDLLSRGVKNVYYLPLAADVDHFQRVIAEDGGKSAAKYAADVSFVGNLYNDGHHSMYDRIAYLPPYIKGYFEALMEAQRTVWGADIISEAVTEEILAETGKYVKLDLGNQYMPGIYKTSLLSMLGQKITQMERKEACSYLARLFDFALYTGCDTSYDTLIRNRGSVDYSAEMPLVFFYSKINIHITMRTITSGISQRVVDVLACGGFLLTNYQPEIEEYFADGEELVVYADFDDMCAKIDYYLKHDAERERIARAGFLKAREMFGYQGRVEEMVRLLNDLEKE